MSITIGAVCIEEKLGIALSMIYCFIRNKARLDRQPFLHIGSKMLIPFVASFSDLMN